VKIGILGGTGNMGRGLTIRLAVKHDILVGSRSLEKAGRIAKNLNNVARGFYLNEMEGSIKLSAFQLNTASPRSRTSRRTSHPRRL
jgi:predicted dinucleotide-binding enzyme